MIISVIDMIPKSLSGLKWQNSEPNLAVNPNNPQQMVGTAFTPNPTGGSNAPIYVSSNGGTTWALNAIVPGATASFPTADITMKFGGTSNVLYGGILRADNINLAVLRTNNYLANNPMTILETRASEDQPWVQATTATAVANRPDRVYIGHNDFNTSPKTATVEQSLNAAIAAPPAGFGPFTLERRTPGAGQDAPSIRPTIHSSGRIYIAYISWTSSAANSIKVADIVVCRDDNWGIAGYSVLKDTDGVAGIKVASGVKIPWQNAHFLGQERVGSHLSIVVDPTNADNVYIAWADNPNGNPPYTIHVRKSTDGGAKWSADLLTVPNGINPALAVNASGYAGFLCQQLVNGNTWQSRVQFSNNGFATVPTVMLLASVPSAQPTATFLPYLGDYIYMTTAGDNFYGVFCANNTPDHANFPSGVTYQRNANFTTHQLLNVDNVTPVEISIDPFFFSVTGLTIKAPNGCAALINSINEVIINRGPKPTVSEWAQMELQLRVCVGEGAITESQYQTILNSIKAFQNPPTPPPPP